MKTQSMHYKEIAPSATVEYIRGVFKDINIEIREEWQPVSSVGTYALRIYIKNSSLGTNGKGVTEDYARASAYAELLERYQNLWLTRSTIRWKSEHRFHYFEDEIEQTAEEIVADDNSFVKMYFSHRNMEEASEEEKAKAFRKVQKTDYNLFGKKSTYTSVPFYSVTYDRLVYLPYNTYNVFYASNGMCAGNTPEEAIVQGLSEVLERYIQKRLFCEKPTLPDIPEKYLRDKCPQILNMYEKLKKINDYNFILKDCSFGGRYPVAALVIIEKNTGRYGIKLGCHPDYSIAIERCFTEAAQGNDITEYVNRSKLDFMNSKTDSQINIFNCFRIGIGQYPYELYAQTPSFEFLPVKDVTNRSNSYFLRDMVSELVQEGYDVLIRDVSYTGFPSFQVIIPEMSEIIDMTDTGFNAINTRIFVSELMNKPELIVPEYCRHIIGIMDFYSESFMDNEMKSHYGVLYKNPVPGEEMNAGWLYLSTMCCIMIGDYEGASSRFSIIVNRVTAENLNKDFYMGIFYYINGRKVMMEHRTVLQYLSNFFDDAICEKLDDIFKEPSKIIVKQYARHNYGDRENCRLNHCCDYPVYADCVDSLRDLQLKNPINQMRNKTYFQEVMYVE